jgi:serine protease
MPIGSSLHGRPGSNPSRRVGVAVRNVDDAPKSEVLAIARRVGAVATPLLPPHCGKEAERTPLAPLRSWWRFSVKDRRSAERLARALSRERWHRYSYLKAQPDAAPSAPATPPAAEAGHLSDAPYGVGARRFWKHHDERGAGVRLTDVERGWKLDHPDLEGLVPDFNGRYGTDHFEHGTAALSVIRSAGGPVRGIAPGLGQARVSSQWRDEHGASVAEPLGDLPESTVVTYDTAGAIVGALATTTEDGQPFLRSGDVLLLEAQCVFGGVAHLPVEIEPMVHAAIRAAVGLGVIVVEAAGNGRMNLDEVTCCGATPFLPAPPEGGVDRCGAWPRDRHSGAILVAASVPCDKGPHALLKSSNFGQRIDAHAQGNGVPAATCDWLGLTDGYTTAFGGTSAAAAIVAGVAVLLQDLASSRGRSLTSKSVRELIRAHGRAGADPNMGFLPDLAALAPHV